MEREPKLTEGVHSIRFEVFNPTDLAKPSLAENKNRWLFRTIGL
jgi:hypothetical protein